MKNLRIILAAMLFSTVGYGQQATVTATIVPYAGGTVVATFQQQGGGAPPTSQRQVSGTINSAGTFSLLAWNNAFSGYKPSATTFNICATASNPSTCYSATVSISGTSQDISTAFAGAPTPPGAGGISAVTGTSPIVATPTGSTVAVSCPTCGTGSGPTGMTAGQVAIAGSATTITSSKPLAGTGTAIITGPASGTTSGNLASFNGTTGQIADSTIASSNVCLKTAGCSLAGTIATLTAGSGATASCASATCTNLRGQILINGGTFVTGTLVSLSWAATPTAYVCTATQNGGTTQFFIGNDIATTTGVNITNTATILSLATLVNYSCQP